LRLQSLQVPRCVFSCAVRVEEEAEERESAIIVLLPKHVHLQNEVGAVTDLSGLRGWSFEVELIRTCCERQGPESEESKQDW
jgi:hypothetical protein